MDDNEMVNKILAWVDANERAQDGGYGSLMVKAQSLKDFLHDLVNPPKALVWHYRTKDNQEWRTMTDDEYELSQHLSRFEFQQFEV